MTAAFITEFITGTLTVLAAWLIGNKSVWGQRVSVLANMGWWIYIIAFGRWGLIPMEVFLSIVVIRNLIKWEKENEHE